MMMRFMLGLSLVLVLACCPCYVRADLPGVSSGPDPFSITFDGNGNATVSVWNGTSYNTPSPETGVLSTDQSINPATGNPYNLGLVLTYALPQSVGLGGISIQSPDLSNPVTASLYFYDIGSNGFMEFLLPFGTGQDASIPKNVYVDFLDYPVPFQETNGKFTFVAGDGTNAGSNFYNGTGIPIVPEPNTFIVMAFGLAALVGYSCWRRKQVVAVC
jgi:hypothetical protein